MKNLSLLLVQATILLFFSCTPLHAQNTLPPGKQRSVDAIRQEDDSDHPTEITPEAIASFEQRARERSQEVRAMLAAGDLVSAGDLYKAAFVLQHGETADDYLLAHVLSTDSLAKGNGDARWLVAATLDRYLQLAGRAQIFGTQYPLDPSKPHPVAAGQNARFAGRTQSPYNEKVLPEAIRADFCVPSVAQQAQNLETLNSGKYPKDHMVAAGCKR